MTLGRALDTCELLTLSPSVGIRATPTSQGCAAAVRRWSAVVFALTQEGARRYLLGGRWLVAEAERDEGLYGVILG